VDLADRLWGRALQHLRDPGRFCEVFVDRELGTIAWPGDVVSLDPDVLAGDETPAAPPPR
jgi:hypothetical protein